MFMEKIYTVINEKINYVIHTILFRVTFVTVSEKIFFVRRWRAQTKYASLEDFFLILKCLFYIFLLIIFCILTRFLSESTYTSSPPFYQLNQIHSNLSRKSRLHTSRTSFHLDYLAIC